MPRTGRPATPIEVKRRRGTLRADRTPTVLALVPAVKRPDLGGGKIIDGLVASGVSSWIGETDIPMVQLAQRLWDDADRLRAVIDEAFDKDAWAAYLNTVKELRACLSLLGLSPSDRSRLGVAEVRARSKLEELMDRREKRAGLPAS